MLYTQDERLNAVEYLCKEAEQVHIITCEGDFYEGTIENITKYRERDMVWLADEEGICEVIDLIIIDVIILMN